MMANWSWTQGLTLMAQVRIPQPNYFFQLIIRWLTRPTITSGSNQLRIRTFDRHRTVGLLVGYWPTVSQ